MNQAPVARQRRHTLYFLRQVRTVAPVFIDTDIDMTSVKGHQAVARGQGQPYSSVAYVVHVAARVMAVHPEANAALGGRLRPRVARYDEVNVKVTLDKTLQGQRVVLATVLRGAHQASLDDIQRQVSRVRDGDAATMPEFAAARLLHRLPPPVGALVFRLGVRPLGRRSETMGTLAVTSLGHRPVGTFFSVGGTTITLGLGQVTERPVAREGRVVVAPTMRLSLTFDHRVIDGAEAADVLAEIKDGLEAFSEGSGPADPATARDGDGKPAPRRAVEASQ